MIYFTKVAELITMGVLGTSDGKGPPGAGRDDFDFLDHVHAADHFAKHGVAKQFGRVDQFAARRVFVDLAAVFEPGYRVTGRNGGGVKKRVVLHVDKKLGRGRLRVVGARHGQCADDVFAGHLWPRPRVLRGPRAGGFFSLRIWRQSHHLAP